jgi:hypothetical protein
MSDKIIDLARRRPKPRNLAVGVPVEPSETKGDELAIIKVRPGDSELWLGVVLSREQYNYVIDMLELARDRVIKQRDS